MNKIVIASLRRTAFSKHSALELRDGKFCNRSIKGLGPKELPLFAAAREAAEQRREEAEADTSAKGDYRPENPLWLRPMTRGREVIEDYDHSGFSLRRHPVSFLRHMLKERKVIACAEAMVSRDRRWCGTAGVVLVCQRPDRPRG